MSEDVLAKLEKRVEYAVELIELLRLQIEELEEENADLKAEQAEWRDELAALLRRFDHVALVTEQD